MRLLACVMALLVSGCFRWAPANSLSSIQDERVQIREAGEGAIITHATAHGQIIEGQAEVGGEHVAVDATQSQVFVRKLNVPATVAIVTGGVVAAAGTFFLAVLITIAFASRPIPVEGAPPP